MGKENGAGGSVPKVILHVHVLQLPASICQGPPNLIRFLSSALKSFWPLYRILIE